MAEAASRAAVRTTLALANVEVAVGLFPTTAKPGELAEFETAGPNGGALRYVQRAQPKSDGEVLAAAAEQDADELARGVDDVRADPFTDDPGPEAGRAQADAMLGAEDRRMKRTGDPFPETAVPAGEFRQVLVEEGSGVEVPRDEVRRGVRLDDGRFVDCTAQLERIEERTKLDRLSIVRFIDVGQVRREMVTGSYYVGATEPEGKRVLRLLMLAMRQTRRVAEAKWTTKSRQARGVLVPFADRMGRTGLIALKLAWAEDFRLPPPSAVLNMGVDVEMPPPMVEQAAELVRAWSVRPGDVEDLRDDAIALREELYARAAAGEMDVEVAEPEPEAQDLAAALERSLAEA